MDQARRPPGQLVRYGGEHGHSDRINTEPIVASAWIDRPKQDCREQVERDRHGEGYPRTAAGVRRTADQIDECPANDEGERPR